MVASTLDAIEDDLADYVTSEEREGIAALASGLFSVERPAFFSRLD